MIYRMNKIVSMLSGFCFTCRQLKQLTKRQRFESCNRYKTITRGKVIKKALQNNGKPADTRKLYRHKGKRKVLTNSISISILIITFDTILWRNRTDSMSSTSHNSDFSLIFDTFFIVDWRTALFVNRIGRFKCVCNSPYEICAMSDFLCNVFRGANFL